MGLTATPLSDAAGAEISGVDFTRPLSGADLADLQQAWRDYMVLVVRGQDLSEDDQERFCRYFGEIAGLKSNKMKSKVLYVTNQEEEGIATAVQTGEMMFHIDQAYSADPCKASTLYSEIIPKAGGNTCFANCCAAYDNLSDKMKDRIKDLHVRNYFNYAVAPSMRPDSIDPDAPQHVHPVVRTHPDTGRKVLFVNRLMSMRIEELDQDESDALLNELFDAIEAPENVYEHVWKVKDLVLWDNRCTAHARTHYDPAERRLLRRMTVIDEKAVA